MKIKILILAMAACAGLFTACSDEMDNVSGNPDEAAGNAYMTLTFTVPSAAGTRAAAGEGGDGYELALTGEYEISDANIFLFEDNLLKQVVTRTALTTGGTPSGNDQSTYTAEKIQVPTGSFKVYVVVNETTKKELTALPIGTTLATFQAQVFAAAKTTGDYCRDKHFLMTNAFVMGNGTPTGSEGEVTITTENTEDKPATVTVHVERAAAKIAMTIPTNRTVEVKDGDTKIGSVLFKSYKVINTRNDAFFLKRVSASVTDFTPSIGGDETSTGATAATNYVLENRFNEKTAFLGQTPNWKNEDSFFQKYYSRKYNTYVAWRTLDNVKNQKLAYCLENTMLQADQVDGLATTVIFRAIYTPEASLIKGTKPEGWDGTFYRYPKGSGESIFYYTLTDLIKAIYGSMAEAQAQGAFGLNSTMDEATVASTLEAITQTDLYQTYSVEEYPQGYCYYTYVIRHANNNDAEIRGVMEHVIVRNNVYQLSVNSVSGVGSVSSGTNGPNPKPEGEGGDLVTDPENPEGPLVPGPGVDEPGIGGNPEIPGTVDPEGPIEPQEPIIPLDPDTPTEQQKTYLNVTVNVLKWVVRNNGMDL